MKTKPSFLSRFWRRLFPAARPGAVVEYPAGQARPLPKHRRHERGIEPLEGRIAPAVLLPNGMDVKYTDENGDAVTIHFSKQLFVPGPGSTTDQILESVFTFSTGKAHTGAATDALDGQQLLQKIDLTKVRPNASTTPATGISFTITAAKQDANHDSVLEGDGLVNVGAISSPGISLGSIAIQGDLGQIDAGNISSAVGVAALKVQSLGKLTNTQAGTADYESTILGQLTTFTADSIDGAYLHVTSASDTGSATAAVGKIGTLTVNHYIKARDLNATGTNDGRVQTSSDIGSIVVGSGFRDPNSAAFSDGLTGGAGASSGTITVGGKITSLTIKGDVRGGAGTGSGSITATGSIGTTQVLGGLLGSGASSAVISSALSLGNVTIGIAGSPGLLGGSGDGSGVLSSSGNIGVVTISSIEGLGTNSGGVHAGGSIASVNVLGYVKGGTGVDSGFIESGGSMGIVKLGGNLEGGTATGTGVVSSGTSITSFAAFDVKGNAADSGGVSANGKIASIALNGSLQGGDTSHSGFIESLTELGTITIKGSIEGGKGFDSGSIMSAGKIGAITIGGHLKGGDATVTPATSTTPQTVSGGEFSGSITAGASGFGGILSVKIGDGLLGGSALNSGIISSAGNIGSLTVARVAASDATLTAISGGDGESSGLVYAFGGIGPVSITGSIKGGVGKNSGTIQEEGRMGAVTITGSLLGGAGEGSGSIVALDSGAVPGSISSVVIKGNITGGDGLRSGNISADGAITSVTTGGLFTGGNSTSGRIISGTGVVSVGNITSLSLGQLGRAAASATSTSPAVTALDAGDVLVYGSVGSISATEMYNAEVHALYSIGGISVSGSVTNTTVTAVGQQFFNNVSDVTISTITVKGNVTHSSFLAGYGMAADAENGHAQIGTVNVSGLWVTSNLVAGVVDANHNGFGDSGDRLIAGNTSRVHSRIGSVVVGNFDGTGGNTGFVAEQIGAFRSVREVLPLTAKAGEYFDYDTRIDSTVTVREVPLVEGVV